MTLDENIKSRYRDRSHFEYFLEHKIIDGLILFSWQAAAAGLWCLLNIFFGFGNFFLSYLANKITQTVQILLISAMIKNSFIQMVIWITSNILSSVHCAMICIYCKFHKNSFITFQVLGFTPFNKTSCAAIAVVFFNLNISLNIRDLKVTQVVT